MKILLLSAITWMFAYPMPISPGDPLKPIRPSDPWVYYTALDQQESVLAVGLDKKLWIALDTTNCSIYKLWCGLGVVQRDGEEKPSAVGVPFIYNEKNKSNWKVWQGGNPVEFTTSFKKYEILENRLLLTYEFTLKGGRKFTVKESPEYLPKKKDAGNRFICERIFTTENVPAGIDVFLAVKCESLMYAADIKTSGKFSNDYKSKYHYDWGSTYDFTGDLKLNANDKTTLKINYTLDQESKARNN